MVLEDVDDFDDVPWMASEMMHQRSRDEGDSVETSGQTS